MGATVLFLFFKITRCLRETRERRRRAVASKRVLANRIEQGRMGGMNKRRVNGGKAKNALAMFEWEGVPVSVLFCY